VGCITNWLTTANSCPQCRHPNPTLYSNGKLVPIKKAKTTTISLDPMSARESLEMALGAEEAGIISAIWDLSMNLLFSFTVGSFEPRLPSVGSVFPRESSVRRSPSRAPNPSPNPVREIPGHPILRDDPEEPRNEVFFHLSQATETNLISKLSKELEDHWETPKVVKGTRKAMGMNMEDTLEFPVLTVIIFQTIDTLGKPQPRSVWLNLYESGQDYAPWHRDSYEGEVAIISIGETRLFRTRVNGGKKVESINFSDGDIIFFNPEWNETHQHTLPKTTKKVKERISVVLFW